MEHSQFLDNKTDFTIKIDYLYKNKNNQKD